MIPKEKYHELINAAELAGFTYLADALLLCLRRDWPEEGE